MENPRLEEENIIKVVRNLYRLKNLRKETTDTTTYNIKNLFRLEKESKTIKGKILRDISKVFRLENKNKAIKDT